MGFLYQTKNSPMRKNIPAFLLMSCSQLLVHHLSAQDPQFTQFYANPLYLNPALAGSQICPRVCFNFRDEWPNISGTYVTTSASFDKVAEPLHGGIGLMATNDEAGQNTIRTTTINGIYSYIQPLSRKFSIAAAMQVTYTQKVVDWSKLTFGDQIDPVQGPVRPTAEVRGLGAKSNLDISSGIVGYTDNFFVGFAVHHLTQPNESVYESGNSILPIRYTLHAGTNLFVGDKKNPELIVSPNIIWQKQQDFEELCLGLYLKKDAIVGGLWYRNRDAFIFLIGFEKNGFRAGYSYDLTVSRLTNTTAGSHEISLSKRFTCKKRKPHYRLIQCPGF
jgi:type IX secretion system PorP/SprF family membrane protein